MWPARIVYRVSSSVALQLPSLTFITLHYAYFIGTCLVTSLVFWVASTPSRSVRYVDSLFFTVSGMTEAGLNTVNLSTLNTFQQVMLFALIIMGSSILVSSVVVHVRRKAFEQRFQGIILEERRRRRTRSGSRTHSTARGISHDCRPSATDVGGRPTSESRNTNTFGHITFSACSAVASPNSPEAASYPRGRLPSQVVAASNTGHSARIGVQDAKGLIEDRAPLDLSSRVSRNSNFHDLTPAERDRLGGVEYRAISILSVTVPLYFILWQLLGCLGIGAYIAYNKADVTRRNGLSPWWTGAFFAVSAFNNSGMSLLDANVMPFRESTYMLITMGLLILAGNTCYPIFLRFILWTIRKVLPHSPRYYDHREALEFLLNHPRRCYTNLFNQTQTWWLLGAVMALNCIDWAAFELLNIGNATTEEIPLGARVLDGLFQAFAVRHGGFYVVNIASLQIGLLILYVIMMYISAYPITITMRSSNVYEERSLGIYADDPSAKEEKQKTFLHHIVKHLPGSSSNSAKAYFMRQQLRAQLAHDLWWIVLAVLFISTIETSQFERDPKTYSVFNILFEVISAYGCVGISVGLPDQMYSFCGGWHSASKLILCAVMLRGRHRGLPVAIDRAVLLPGEHLAVAEEEDAQIRMERAISRGGEKSSEGFSTARESEIV